MTNLAILVQQMIEKSSTSQKDVSAETPIQSYSSTKGRGRPPKSILPSATPVSKGVPNEISTSKLFFTNEGMTN